MLFYLTLISTICNEGTWKSVHLHTVHQANKEKEPLEVLCLMRCILGGANHLQRFNDGEKKAVKIVYRFLFRMNIIGDIQTGHWRRLLGVLTWGEKNNLKAY